MTRTSASVLLALSVLCAQPAAAQTIAGTGGSTSTLTTITAGTSSPSSGTSSGNAGDLQIKLLKAGGVDWPRADQLPRNVPINKAACEEGTIVVQISNLVVATGFPYLEAWLATGTGACNESGRGTRVSVAERCTQLPLSDMDSQILNRSYYDVEVPLNETCDANGKRTIFFLALQSQGSNETAMHYGAMDIKIDTVAPPAPTNVQGGSGETQIPVTWDSPLTETNNMKLWVLVDTNVGVGPDIEGDGGTPDASAPTSDCYSSLLVPGRNYDVNATLPDGILRQTFDMRKSETTFSGDEFFGKKIAAAGVIAFDLAGNPSVMSDTVCLYVKDTVGFWDSYKTNGGEAGSGWGCSTLSWRGARAGALTGLPMLLVLGWFGVRRRIRRRAR